MKDERVWYRLGIGLAMACIVIAQLIWLFDPIRIGQHIFLIDLIDRAIYAVLFPPLLWAVGAVQGMLSHGRIMWSRCIIIISSNVGCLAIVIDLAYVLTAAICFLIALVLVLTLSFIEDWRGKRRFPLMKGLKVMLSVAIFVTLLLPMPYMVTYPGLTMNMHRYAAAQMDATHASQLEQKTGYVAGVLVFERPAFPIDWLYARLFPHYEFRKIQPSDPSLSTQLNAVRLMKHSTNQLSTALALEKVGLGKGVTFLGARVVDTVAHSAAAKRLQSGDVIVNVNGHPVTTARELIMHTEGVRPGDDIELIVMRDGAELTLQLPTGADSNDPKRAVIGVHIMDATELDVPVPVHFHRYALHEGGPSHGAMLTLGLIDQLTPGGIMSGLKVAGTGTINLDGTIGRIGGIKQKAFIVQRSGADVFFVPHGQQEDALKGAPKLNIVPVKTLDDILQWLEDHHVQSEV